MDYLFDETVMVEKMSLNCKRIQRGFFMKGVKLLFSFVVVSALILAGCNNEEENYPSSSIEILIPYSPGGQTDLSARAYAEHLQKYLDTEVVVVNQTGGGGVTAINEVISDNSDGHKFLLHHDAMHTAYAIDQVDVTYEEMTPVDVSASVNQAYVVPESAPWDTLEEFVQDASENPGEYIYATDIGGTTHFMGGTLMEETNIDLAVQDVGGESERMTALLGNQADIAVTSVSNAVSYVESGDYKVLATLTEERDPLAPDFPTAIEQGYDITFPVTNVLYGPEDLSDEVLQKWDEATENLVNDEEYQEALENIYVVHDENVDHEGALQHVEGSFNSMQSIAENLGF